MALFGLPDVDVLGALGIPSKLGSNFQATPANIQSPVTADQLAQAQLQTQGVIGQQQSLAQALQGIGLGNQQQGVQGQLGVLNQQQALAQALQNQALGQGPNPAQQALANATGQNVANQAALMAGQRGASANVGLMAEQAARQGAGIQQNAVGQSAQLQAQQQIAAQQALMQQQQAMAQGYGNIGGMGLQQGQQQIGQMSNLGNLALGQQQALLGGQGSYNQAQVSNIGAANQANAMTQAANAQMTGQMIGGALGGLGALGAGALMSPAAATLPAATTGAFGGSLGASASGTGLLGVNTKLYDGGLVDIGRIYHPEKNYAYGGMSMKDGGKVPGKPEVEGKVDTPKNDTVAAKLSPGEIVLPRSVVNSDNPGEAARAFVEKLLQSKGKAGSKKDHNDFKQALENQIKSRKVK